MASFMPHLSFRVFFFIVPTFFLWFTSYFFVFAQTNLPSIPTSPSVPGEAPTNIPPLPTPTPFAVCLAQSASASVTFTTLSHPNTSYQPGDTVNISAKIKSTLSRPIQGGVVFVRLSRVNTDASMVIFEKVLFDNLSLFSGEEKELKLSLVLPKSTTLIKGDYRADFYILDSDGRLPLSTSPLFDSAHSIRFSLSGPVNGLYFQTSDARINNRIPGALLEALSLGGPVTIAQAITNDSTQSRSLSVNYEIFYQDNFVKGEALNRHTDAITLLPKEKKNISYTVPGLSAGDYYARVSLVESGQTIAVERMRFTVGSATPRLRYSGMVFGREDGEYSLVACLTSQATTTATLSLSVLDQGGKTLLASSTQGPALLLPLSPRYASKGSTMIAEVKNIDGVVLDRLEQKIVCQDSVMCGSVSRINGPYVFIGTVLLVILGVMVIYYIKRKHE